MVRGSRATRDASRQGPQWAALAQALVVLAGVGWATAAGAQGSEATDRTALEAFYRATGGQNWTNNTNWLSEEPLDTWHGVITQENRVIGLSLHQNALSGPLPPALGSLTNVELLSLGGNALSGPLPPELGHLANLQRVFLWENALSGPIPPELGNLTNLRFLDLSRNGLSGPIPAALGNPRTLQDLWLNDNQLSGSIPAELADLTLDGRGGLRLWDNQLSGCIPQLLAAHAEFARFGINPQRDGVNLPLCSGRPPAWTFTDSTLMPRVTPVKAVHFTELRAAVNELRGRCGRGAFGWTDPTVTPDVTPVKAVHLMELRQALTEAYGACSLTPAPAYTGTLSRGAPIQAAHLTELRDAVVHGLEETTN